MNIHYTVSSTNRKTGPMLVTTTSKDTCPASCPFNDGGCYAKYGPMHAHWAMVTNGDRSKDWGDFLLEVKKLRKGSLWRWAQAGDLPGVGEDIDVDRLNEIIAANKGKCGFGYTHKPMTEKNAELIRQANQRGFTLNLSANGLQNADEKMALGVGPVVAAVPERYESLPKRTPAGHPVVVCLNVTKGLTCAQCGLCAVATRKSIVAFPAHGRGKAKVEKVVS